MRPRRKKSVVAQIRELEPGGEWVYDPSKRHWRNLKTGDFVQCAFTCRCEDPCGHRGEWFCYYEDPEKATRRLCILEV